MTNGSLMKVKSTAEHSPLEMQHNIMISLKHNNDITYLLMCGCSMFYLSHGLVRGMGDRISHMDKNSRNSDLVCNN